MTFLNPTLKQLIDAAKDWDVQGSVPGNIQDSGIQFINHLAQRIKEDKKSYSLTYPRLQPHHGDIIPFLTKVMCGAIFYELKKPDVNEALAERMLALFSITDIHQIPMAELTTCLSCLEHFVKVIEKKDPQIARWKTNLTNAQLLESIQSQLNPLISQRKGALFAFAQPLDPQALQEVAPNGWHRLVPPPTPTEQQPSDEPYAARQHSHDRQRYTLAPSPQSLTEDDLNQYIDAAIKSVEIVKPQQVAPSAGGWFFSIFSATNTSQNESAITRSNRAIFFSNIGRFIKELKKNLPASDESFLNLKRVITGAMMLNEKPAGSAETTAEVQCPLEKHILSTLGVEALSNIETTEVIASLNALMEFINDIKPTDMQTAISTMEWHPALGKSQLLEKINAQLGTLSSHEMILNHERVAVGVSC